MKLFTVTVKDFDALLPAASAAVQFTVEAPTGNVPPAVETLVAPAAEHVSVFTPTASVAVTE